VSRRSLGRVLGRAFYAMDARELAPQLLNKLVVHDDPSGHRLAARIVEVEAYAGSEDAGSHSYRGPTRRNATMFGPAGHLYVYFTYGMHWCMNVVAGGELAATAVLLRAGAPVAGIETMRSRRPAARRNRDLCSGPARLAQAVSTRVGLGAGKGDLHPWRYYVPGDPNVSRGPVGVVQRMRP